MRKATIGLAIMALVLVLVGCAPAATPTAPPAATPTPVPPTPTPAAPARPEGVPAPGEDEVVDAIYERGTLNACQAQAMPVVGIDANTGKFFGVGPEFGKELAQRMGVEYQDVGAEWDTLIPNVQTGKCDIITAGLGYGAERAEVVDYALIPIKCGSCYIKRKDDDRFSTWEEIIDPATGITACAITGTGAEHTWRTQYPDVDFYSMPAPGAQGLMEEVVAGRCDANNMDNWVIPYILAQYPTLGVVPEDCVDSPLETYDWGFAVLKGYPKWHEYVLNVVDELKEAGWFHDQFGYFMSPEEMDRQFAE